MNWIRLAVFGIIAAAAIAAAMRWPGDIAANAIMPLTLIACTWFGYFGGDDRAAYDPASEILSRGAPAV